MVHLKSDLDLFHLNIGGVEFGVNGVSVTLFSCIIVFEKVVSDVRDFLW